MSETAQQKITFHTLSNISGSKVNQTMKFDPLIEYEKYFCVKIIKKMLSRS